MWELEIERGEEKIKKNEEIVVFLLIREKGKEKENWGVEEVVKGREGGRGKEKEGRKGKERGKGREKEKEKEKTHIFRHNACTQSVEKKKLKR